MLFECDKNDQGNVNSQDFPWIILHYFVIFCHILSYFVISYTYFITSLFWAWILSNTPRAEHQRPGHVVCEVNPGWTNGQSMIFILSIVSPNISYYLSKRCLVLVCSISYSILYIYPITSWIHIACIYSIHIYTYNATCIYTYVYIYLSIYLSIYHLSIYLSIYIYICMYTSIYLHIYILYTITWLVRELHSALHLDTSLHEVVLCHQRTENTATTVTLRVEAVNGAHPSPATWLSRSVGIWDDIYGDIYIYILK